MSIAKPYVSWFWNINKRLTIFLISPLVSVQCYSNACCADDLVPKDLQRWTIEYSARGLETRESVKLDSDGKVVVVSRKNRHEVQLPEPAVNLIFHNTREIFNGYRLRGMFRPTDEDVTFNIQINDETGCGIRFQLQTRDFALPEIFHPVRTVRAVGTEHGVRILESLDIYKNKEVPLPLVPSNRVSVNDGWCIELFARSASQVEKSRLDLCSDKLIFYTGREKVIELSTDVTKRLEIARGFLDHFRLRNKMAEDNDRRDEVQFDVRFVDNFLAHFTCARESLTEKGVLDRLDKLSDSLNRDLETRGHAQRFDPPWRRKPNVVN